MSITDKIRKSDVGAETMLDCIKFDISIYSEDDGSITVASNDMDLAENAEDKETAIQALAASILDYAREFVDNYPCYSNAPNRRPHIPFITKAFLLDNERKVQAEMICGGLKEQLELVIKEDQDEGGYAAYYPDLPGCITCGETIEAVKANAIDAKSAWFDAIIEDFYKEMNDPE